MSAPARLRLDGNVLVSNWRWLAARSGGAACGAAIKADGYGLGARAVMTRLAKAGCRDFFVATWHEVEALGSLPDGCTVSVLHGVREDDMAVATASHARPVLNTQHQVARWRPTGRPCDVMFDTGMNRLGLAPHDDASGLAIDVLMSHLACADQDSPMNTGQLAAFAAIDVPAKRRSLANSAGICLGHDFAFDLTRPGLALYGGLPRSEARSHISPVVHIEAQVVQRRMVRSGESIGYGATFRAPRDTQVAVLNIGYADGFRRAFSGHAPILGRVSMDLIAVDVSACPDIGEGEWYGVPFALAEASAATGLSQYELLTGLGPRFERIWT